MSVVETLKAKSLELRKSKNPVAPAITFALSEIEKVGKNSGNRATTQDEAIRVVQKLIATIDENLKLNIDDGRRVSLNYERQILQSVLPQMVSADEIKKKLMLTFTDKPANKGEVMKWARAEWGSLADMKQVGAIASELWGI
jgi:uncharacterized protein YqeY